MALFASAWKRITSDPWVLDSVSHCHIEFDSLPIQNSIPREIKFSSSDTILVDCEISKLLEKQAIEPCLHQNDEFISNIFLTPKKDGSLRPVINLKNLNKFVSYHHFKMETLSTALLLIEPDCYLASIDLKDAYFSIPIASEHRKFLRFQWRGKLYQFCVLPFGLSSAPRVFTKVLIPAIATLRNLGYISCNYIDDALLIGNSFQDCLLNVHARVQLFESLGFIVNKQKSVLQPCKRIEFLGFIIDSSSMQISLPERRVHAIVRSCRNLRVTPNAKIRQICHVIGLMVSSEVAVPYGSIFRRDLEILKNACLLDNPDNFDAKFVLTDLGKEALLWWELHTPLAFSPLRRKVDIIIETDASLAGWGAFCSTNNTSTQGQWKPSELDLHINALELLAILFALQALCTDLHDVHIFVKSDNVTAVSCVNNFGTCHSEQLHTISRKLWLWGMSRNIWISAKHVPGKLNCIADFFSRQFNDNIEWTLDSSVFLRITQTFFVPDIDLFASRINKRMSPFVSWFPDPEAVASDAFSLDWKDFKAYIFPPFCLINKVLAKIWEDEADAILVAPLWNTQSWYPKMLALLVDFPVILPLTEHILFLPSSNRRHPLSGHMKLVACRLSGNRFASEEFRRQLSVLSSNHGVVQLGSHTSQLSTSGFCSAVKGVKIPFLVM